MSMTFHQAILYWKFRKRISFIRPVPFPRIQTSRNLNFLDRQIMLFSATFKKRIERLARDSLVDPVKIVQVSVRLRLGWVGLGWVGLD
jgi:superfamily II DNA/RNA helicase